MSTFQERFTDSAPARTEREDDGELALLVAVKAGDRAAFGALVERHLVRALALAFRVVHHAEDAEDIVHDAFLAALEHIDAFDGRRPFWPWLARIIVNRGIDFTDARAVRHTEPLPDDLIDVSTDAHALAERREILTQVRHELALMPPRQQLVMQLHEIDGYSVAEIADLLDSAQTAVRWHIHTGRRRLRKALAPLREDAQ